MGGRKGARGVAAHMQPLGGWLVPDKVVRMAVGGHALHTGCSMWPLHVATRVSEGSNKPRRTTPDPWGGCDQVFMFCCWCHPVVSTPGGRGGGGRHHSKHKVYTEGAPTHCQCISSTDPDGGVPAASRAGDPVGVTWFWQTVFNRCVANNCTLHAEVLGSSLHVLSLLWGRGWGVGGCGGCAGKAWPLGSF